MRFLPLALSILLSVTACAHAPTTSSLARTERPAMPKPPTELTQKERLQPIERGDLNEYVERHGEAASAVERLNNRINGWQRLWDCVSRALASGAVPDACK